MCDQIQCKLVSRHADCVTVHRKLIRYPKIRNTNSRNHNKTTIAHKASAQQLPKLTARKARSAISILYVSRDLVIKTVSTIVIKR